MSTLIEMFWQLNMEDSTKAYVVVFGIMAFCLYLMWASSDKEIDDSGTGKKNKKKKGVKFWQDNKFWFIAVVSIILLYVCTY